MESFQGLACYLLTLILGIWAAAPSLIHPWPWGHLQLQAESSASLQPELLSHIKQRHPQPSLQNRVHPGMARGTPFPPVIPFFVEPEGQTSSFLMPSSLPQFSPCLLESFQLHRQSGPSQLLVWVESRGCHSPQRCGGEGGFTGNAWELGSVYNTCCFVWC